MKLAGFLLAAGAVLISSGPARSQDATPSLRFEFADHLVLFEPYGSEEQTLARTEEQVNAARKYCADNMKRGIYPFGCPVQFSTKGPLSAR